MVKIVDPDGNETRVIHELVEFDGKDVVEIGCGNGRMTWRYAHAAASVLGLDPDEAAIASAIESTPAELVTQVSFRTQDISTVKLPRESFDVAVLAWSL